MEKQAGKIITAKTEKPSRNVAFLQPPLPYFRKPLFSLVT